MACSLNPFDLLKANDIETLKRTVRHDPAQAASRNEDGVSLLMMCLYYKQPEIAALVAEQLPSLDAFEAAALGKTELLEQLLPVDRAPDPISPDGFTPLHLAAFFGHSETAAFLLNKGADPNHEAENPSRVRPLHSAAAARSLPTAQLLLEHRADPNAQQSGGWTALHAACMHQLKDLARLLIQAGANPTLTADDGRDARALLGPDVDPKEFGLVTKDA